MTVRRAVIGLGSNLGSRGALIRAALALLGDDEALGLGRVSTVRETPPVGPPQPAYLNAAALLHTALAPDEILRRLLEAELDLGRVRDRRWGPRLIDLDLLWVEGERVEGDALTVPHPELTRRPFALGPLLELCPDAIDPRDGTSFASSCAAEESAWGALAPATVDRFEPVSHTADEAFRAGATDRPSLMACCADALGALMVEPETVPARVVRLVSAEAGDGAFASDEERLFSWLSSVLWTLDTQRFALRCAVVTADDDSVVRGLLVGDHLDATHRVNGAVKAITWHGLSVVDRGGRWEAAVVVDV